MEKYFVISGDRSPHILLTQGSHENNIPDFITVSVVIVSKERGKFRELQAVRVSSVIGKARRMIQRTNEKT